MTVTQPAGEDTPESCVDAGCCSNRFFTPVISARNDRLLGTEHRRIRLANLRAQSILHTKKHQLFSWCLLCWHYLSSRQVTLQVLSARMSLTSVFGMGTGGPSSQSIPTCVGGLLPPLCQSVAALTAWRLYQLPPHLSTPFRISK